MSQKMKTQRGAALRKMLLAIENPPPKQQGPKTQHVSLKVPVPLVKTVDMLATRMRTTRTQVLVMLVGTALSEMLAEGKATLATLVRSDEPR